MKTVNTVVVTLLLFVSLAVVMPAAAQPARMYDKDVKALLEQSKKSYEHFWDALDGQLKNSTFRVPAGEFVAKKVDEDYKNALDTALDRLKDTYAAGNEVGAIFTQAVRFDRYVKQQGPTMKGASEWQVHVAQLGQLANEYGAAFPPAENQVFRRYTDKDVVQAASSLEQAAKRLADTLDDSLKKDKNTPEASRKAMVADVKRLGESAKTLGSAVDDNKPASALAVTLFDQATKAHTAITTSGVAAAMSQWSGLEGTIGTIKSAFHQK